LIIIIIEILTIKLNRMDTVECKELIVSTLKRRGTGIEHGPIRIITEVLCQRTMIMCNKLCFNQERSIAHNGA
jgi:hypothetical protein